jgi:hypothetical protein
VLSSRDLHLAVKVLGRPHRRTRTRPYADPCTDTLLWARPGTDGQQSAGSGREAALEFEVTELVDRAGWESHDLPHEASTSWCHSKCGQLDPPMPT